jgi:hypothetical protein
MTAKKLVYTLDQILSCSCSDLNAFLSGKKCLCNSGYSSNGTLCKLINYCQENTGGCSDICNYTGPGKYECICSDPLDVLSGRTCVCPSGYTSNGRNWTVINQCEDNTHGCQDSCQFIEPGIYQCVCDDPNAHVYDFNQCICNQGYSGDGNECTAVDYYLNNTHDQVLINVSAVIQMHTWLD